MKNYFQAKNELIDALHEVGLGVFSIRGYNSDRLIIYDAWNKIQRKIVTTITNVNPSDLFKINKMEMQVYGGPRPTTIKFRHLSLKRNRRRTSEFYSQNIKGKKVTGARSIVKDLLGTTYLETSINRVTIRFGELQTYYDVSLSYDYNLNTIFRIHQKFDRSLENFKTIETQDETLISMLRSVVMDGSQIDPLKDALLERYPWMDREKQ